MAVTPTPKTFPGMSGFEEVSSVGTHALLVCSQALEKRGKTHFALTAPGPVGIISTDTGTEEIAAKFVAEGKRVALLPCRAPKTLKNKGEMDDEWSKIQRGWDSIIENKDMRTIITDTHTEFWQTMRLAEFGKMEQIPPKKYDEVNKKMRDMIKCVKQRRDLNAVFIHKYKKEYAGTRKPDGSAGMDSWTGFYERAGFGDMGFLCDVVVEHNFASPKEPGRKAPVYPVGGGGPFDDDYTIGERDFYIRIVDTRFGMQSNIGEVLGGEYCTFPYLAMQLLPDVSPEVWL